MPRFPLFLKLEPVQVFSSLNDGVFAVVQKLVLALPEKKYAILYTRYQIPDTIYQNAYSPHQQISLQEGRR